MIINKRALIKAGAIFVSLGLAFPGISMAQEKHTIKFGAWMPKSHVSNSVFLEEWKKDVEERTEGRVEVDIIYSPIGKPAQYLDLVRRGVLGATYGVHGYQPGRFFLTQAAEMPFLANSSEVLSLAYWRTHQKVLAEHEEHKGVRLLSLFTHGPGVYFSREDEPNSIDDFEGKKLRVGGGIANEVAKNLGVVPLLAPSTASYEMLSTGVIDGLMFPADSVPVYNLDDILQYGTRLDGGFYNTSFYVAMNEDVFDSLSEEDKEIISSLSGEYMARAIGRAWDSADAEGYKAMESKGVKINFASPELEEDLREAMSKVEQEWIDKAEEKGIDGKLILDTLRDEIANAKAEINAE